MNLPNYFPSKEKLIAVGMSGGVDSSVVAALLKREGHNVIGIFMKNWEEEDENGVCQASKEYADVEAVCDLLDIPCYSVDFVEEYKNRVFNEFLSEYNEGFTPNPDILCNREIKFDVFYKKALEMGAEFVATGHYCQSIPNCYDRAFSLVKGVDSNKDQTYFLYAIDGNLLKNVLFPIGHLRKAEVRQLAKDWGLPTKEKKDSTGICFIGERNFKNFLSQYIKKQRGDFRTLSGEKVGEHSGACFYTIGQRKGLGLGGPGRPWYVVKKDQNTNTVFVERGEHPALFRSSAKLFRLSWINSSFFENLTFPYRCKAKVRYRQEDQPCVINKISKQELEVVFDVPQRAMALRQSIVFYQRIEDQEVCLGGGMIRTVGPSLWDFTSTSN